jgi:MFS family permease
MAGVSVGQIAALVSLSVLPHTWKFFWAPVADVTLNQTKWYFISATLTAIGIAAMGMFPATTRGLAALSAVVFVTSLAVTFVGMAVESLMAHCTPEELKGRAGGWFQAGNLGGAGIGGGLGLLLAQRLPSDWMASCIVGFLCLLCCLALAGLPTPERMEAGGLVASIRGSLAELWHVVRQRAGAVALILCFLPIGSGAAQGLWSAVAPEWRVTAETVALVTGLLGGIVSAAGCIVGGWICDRMDRKAAYVWFGILQAGAAVAMAMFPRSQAMFIGWTSLYAFIMGMTYAGFSAFVLEAIGKGAAATKYSAFASLSNMPIYYMTIINGWAHDRWGSSGMLFTEALLCVIGASVFVVLARGMGGRSTR